MRSNVFRFFRKTAYLFVVISVAGALYSCKSSRPMQEKEMSRKEISNRLGIKIGSRDNIRLYQEAALWLKTPHTEGGSSKNGIDCSFLAYIIYRSVYQINIGRSTVDILEKNCKRITRNRLKEGDLVFFNTQKKKSIMVNHVGIYLKEGKFIHTSTSKGVVVSNLKEEYYQKTWVCGGRVK